MMFEPNRKLKNDSYILGAYRKSNGMPLRFYKCIKSDYDTLF